MTYLSPKFDNHFFYNLENKLCTKYIHSKLKTTYYYANGLIF